MLLCWFLKETMFGVQKLFKTKKRLEGFEQISPAINFAGKHKRKKKNVITINLFLASYE